MSRVLYQFKIFTSISNSQIILPSLLRILSSCCSRCLLRTGGGVRQVIVVIVFMFIVFILVSRVLHSPPEENPSYLLLYPLPPYYPPTPPHPHPLPPLQIYANERILGWGWKQLQQQRISWQRWSHIERFRGGGWWQRQWYVDEKDKGRGVSWAV